MKHNLIIIAFVVGLIALFAFNSCVLDVLEVQDTMDGFITNANASNYSNLKKYTHSGATDYAGADYDFWETRLSTYIPLTLGVTTADSATASGGGATFTFELEDDDGDMKISRILQIGVTTVFE